MNTDRLLAVVFVALLALVSASAAASTDELDASELTEELIERYSAMDSFAMEFDQTSHWTLADSTFTTSGTLSVERPGRIAVSYAGGGTIVIRGDSLRAYAPETNQFFVAGIDTASSVIDPARLLKGYRPDPENPILSTRDDPRFDVPPPSGTVSLALRPRERLIEPSRLVVRVDPDQRRVLSILAVAASGDWTRYDIRSERRVGHHPPGTFVLSRPRGAELVTGMPFGGF